MKATAALKREVTPDIVDTFLRYHAAINALDFDAIEGFFAETAVYISEKVGVLEGRDEILKGFRAYFAEYGDQTARDETVEAISDRAVRSSWSAEATSASTGEKMLRSGEQTAFFNQDGLIEKVIVRDRQPA